MPFKRFKGVLERPFRVFEEKLRLSILNSLKWQIELSPGICPLRPQRVIIASVSPFRLAWLHSPLSLPTESGFTWIAVRSVIRKDAVPSHAEDGITASIFSFVRQKEPDSLRRAIDVLVISASQRFFCPGLRVISCYSSSGIYSTISSILQFKIWQRTSSVWVDTYIFFFRRPIWPALKP